MNSHERGHDVAQQCTWPMNFRTRLTKGSANNISTDNNLDRQLAAQVSRAEQRVSPKFYCCNRGAWVRRRICAFLAEIPGSCTLTIMTNYGSFHGGYGSFQKSLRGRYGSFNGRYGSFDGSSLGKEGSCGNCGSFHRSFHASLPLP